MRARKVRPAMRKKIDVIFSMLMLAFGVAVVLASMWVLPHSIDRAGAAPDATPIPVASLHLAVPDEREPETTPEPIVPEPVHAYCPDIPLSAELQGVLYEACAEHEVPVALALGVIQVESGFQVDAVSPEGCAGLMQLNPRYFKDGLSPADNLRTGVEYLGRLLAQYGDTERALMAYNNGPGGARKLWDAGTYQTDYTRKVMTALEHWTSILED